MSTEPVLVERQLPTKGATLRRLRKLHGMTMGDVARFITRYAEQKVTVAQVSDWERDRKAPDLFEESQFLLAIIGHMQFGHAAKKG